MPPGACFIALASRWNRVGSPWLFRAPSSAAHVPGRRRPSAGFRHGRQTGTRYLPQSSEEIPQGCRAAIRDTPQSCCGPLRAAGNMVAPPPWRDRRPARAHRRCPSLPLP